MTDDHVPPKNLFAKPRPHLIVISACGECHSSTSKDDEYFRLTVCMSEGAGGHPKARANWESILRSLKRENAVGFQRSFVSSIELIRVHTPGGLYLGERLAYDVDLNRLRRVVERTVRGLYFAEYRHPLGPANDVQIHPKEDFDNAEPDLKKELVQTILRPLTLREPTIIGENVFSYWFHIAPEEPELSVWALTFYDSVHFLCFTAPHGLEAKVIEKKI